MAVARAGIADRRKAAVPALGNIELLIIAMSFPHTAYHLTVMAKRLKTTQNDEEPTREVEWNSNHVPTALVHV